MTISLRRARLGFPLAACSLAMLGALACSKTPHAAGDAGTPGSLAPPTGLTATASSTAQSVSLVWNAESAATGGYQIWRSAGSDAPAQLASSPSNGYTDTGTPPGTQLTYTVRAMDNNGNVTDDSNSATALTVPDAPADLASTAITDSSISISWTEAMGAEGGDTVTYVTGHEQPVTIGATGSSFTASGLLADTLYTFTIVARDATGSGPAATASFTTLASGNPGGGSGGGAGGGSGGGSAGGNAGGSAGGSGGGSAGGSGGGSGGPGDAFDINAYGSDSIIVLQWDDQGAASYQVYRAHGTSAAYTMIGTTSVANYADTGMSPNTIHTNDSYSYYVIPLDGSGNPSPASSAASATALGVALQDTGYFVGDATTGSMAADFSNGIAAGPYGTAYQIIPSFPDGGFDADPNDALSSYGSSDGHAVFPGMAAQTYLLIGTRPANAYTYMPSSARLLTANSAAPGRSDAVAGDTNIQIRLTSLDPWDVNADELELVSFGGSNSSYSTESVSDALSNPLADGGTIASGTFDNATISSAGVLINSAEGDIVYFLQQETDTSGNTPYMAVRNGYVATSVNQTLSQVPSVSGAMVATPTITEALAISRNPSDGANAFLTYIGAVNPGAAAGDGSSPQGYGAVEIGAELGYSTYGSYALRADILTPPPYGNYAAAVPFAPPLLTGNFPSGITDVSFGAAGMMTATNPFPASWDLFLTAYVPYTVLLPVGDGNSAPVTGRIQTVGLLSSFVSGSGITVGAQVSPVQSPKINGSAASSHANTPLNFSVASPLVFSWKAPAVGTPNLYTVTIWDVDDSGITNAPELVFQTPGLSATIPANFLPAASTFVAFITATVTDQDRFGAGLISADGSAASADCISSIFTLN